LEVLRDVNLVWDNCYLYNEPYSWIVGAAATLQRSFIKKMLEHKDKFTQEELDLAHEPSLHKYHPQEKPVVTPVASSPATSSLHSPATHPKHKSKARHPPAPKPASGSFTIPQANHSGLPPPGSFAGRGTRHTSYKIPPHKPNLDEVLDSFEGFGHIYITFLLLLVIISH
jgi:hypothetical protein